MLDSDDEMSDSDDEMWDSESDSEEYDMFDPASYKPAEHEDVSFNVEPAMKFWDSDNNGTVIGRVVFQNSLKSLEENEENENEDNEHEDEEEDEDEPDIIRILVDKSNNALSFIDNGVGMTKDELEERFESSTRRALLKVAHKVVVRTKHYGEDEYVMELSPKQVKKKEKKIFVATEKDPDLIFRGKSRGTKITLFLKQGEVGPFLEFPTYRVMAEKYFSTKIKYYHIYIFSKEEGESVKVTGFNPNSYGLFRFKYNVNDPAVNFLDPYPIPRFVTTSTS